MPRPPLRRLRNFMLNPGLIAALLGVLAASVHEATGHVPAAVWYLFAAPAGLHATAAFNWLTWSTDDEL